MKWLWLVLGISLIGNGFGLYLLDRSLDYREHLRHLEQSFYNKGLHLTEAKDIAQLEDKEAVSLIGGSLLRYWHLPSLKNVHLVNMGGSEESSGTTLQRMQDTVFALDADNVLINAGFCDIHTTVYAGGDIQATLQKVLQNTAAIVEQAREEQVTPVISTLPPVRPRVVFPYFKFIEYDKHKKELENQAIERLNHLLRDFAQQQDVQLIDFHEVLKNPSGQLQQKYALQDGEHLNWKGYRALEEEVREALSFKL